LNPALDTENLEYTALDGQKLYIGKNNNALMPYAGYCSFSQTEQAFQRGQEDKPFTIAMECEVMPYGGDSLTLPLARKGLAGEPVGLVCRTNSNNPIAWARVRFRNFSTSNIAAFYTSFLTTPPVTLGQKHLLVMSYCGDKFAGSSCFKFYVNGVSIPFIAEGTMTESHEFENETTTLTIGGTNGHPNAVSRLTMWKRELTETEIALGSSLFDLHETDKIVDVVGSTGYGSTVYNALGSNHGTLTNVTLATVWGTPLNTISPWNELRGFSLYYNSSTLEYLRVPFDNEGKPLTITAPAGFTLVRHHYSGDWFNDSESYFKLEDTSVGSDIMLADIDEIFFDHATGEAKWFNIRDVYEKNRGYFYVDAGNLGEKKKLVIYKTDKTLQFDVDVLLWADMDDIIVRNLTTKLITFDGYDHAVLNKTKVELNYI